MLSKPRSVVRLGLYIDTELLAWVRERSRLGDPFTGDSHAVEVVLKRLHDEQEFIQQQCTLHGVKYVPAAFWNLYGALRSQSVPNPRGRRHPEKHVDRRECWASVAAHWQKWIDQQCNEGGFESTGHLVETGFRHLRLSEPAQRPVAFLGFPFDGAAMWASYQKELAALRSRGKT